MSSTYYTTEGIVIKKTPYGEADFWVRVLTRDFGKIDLRMRGGRKYNSKLNSHLDFLDCANVSFVKNGENMPTIIDSQKILSNEQWVYEENNLREAVLVARAMDLLIPFEVRDTKVFLLFKKFFESKVDAKSVLEDIVSHEGYGKVSALPKEAQDFIISKWPATLENL